MKVRQALWAMRFSKSVLETPERKCFSQDWVKWTPTRPASRSLKGAPPTSQVIWSFRSLASAFPLSGGPIFNRNPPLDRLTFFTSTNVTVRNSETISRRVTCHPPPSMYAGAGDASKRIRAAETTDLINARALNLEDLTVAS